MPLCLVSMLAVLSLFLLCASGQTNGGIPFTPAGIRSIAGKNVCEFQGEFLYASGVYLDLEKLRSIDYRERDGVAAVFLLNKPTEECAVVDAALDLTRLIRKGESIEFKCYTAHEGGTTLGKWGYVIGLADNHGWLKRSVRARLAWKVDVMEKRFEKLKGQWATCDTAGYED
jgi:hypothetical protein